MIELQYYISNIPDCLIYGLLAMGIYISLRILDIPDLTTEGSFGFGAVISVLVALNGHPILALFAGIVAGAVAGAITGLLQTKLQVHPVLAGIITMSGLYSINLVCYSLTEKGATTNLSYNKITIFEKVKEIKAEKNLDGIELQVNAKNKAAYEMYCNYGFTEKSIHMELL